MITYSIEFLLSLRDNLQKDIPPPQFVNTCDCCVRHVRSLNNNLDENKYKDNKNETWRKNNKNKNNKNKDNKNKETLKYNKNKYNNYKVKVDFKEQSKPDAVIIKKHDIKAFDDLVSLVNKISDKNFDNLIKKMKPISLEIDDSKLVDYLFERISKEQTFIDIYIRIIKSLNTSKFALTEMCIKHANADNLNANKAEGIGRIYKHDLISKETITEIIKKMIKSIKSNENNGNIDKNLDVNSEILCRLLIIVGKIKVVELKSVESELLESCLLSICINSNQSSSTLDLINNLNITKTAIFNKVKVLLCKDLDTERKLLENLMKFLPYVLTVVQIKKLIATFQKEIQMKFVMDTEKTTVNLKTSLICFILKNEIRLNLDEFIPFLMQIAPKLDSRVKFLIEDVKDISAKVNN